jgi:hypothetical protein
MKSSAEYIAFTKTVNAILSVPREEIMRREAEYRAQVDANPNRPGPKRGWKPKKRKAKQPSASPGPVSGSRA